MPRCAERKDVAIPALFAFLHHLAAFTLVSALVAEFILIRDEITTQHARKILTIDTIFGASAGLLLVVGLLRVFYFEKGAAYSRGLYHSDSLGGSSAVRLPDKGKSGH